jgi:galactose mutarotase-like enzyme
MPINLENDQIKVVLSTYAGQIESIINKRTGNEHWWPYDQQWWPRRTSICFPICGGLVDEEYTYQGKTYRLPMHGFLREKEFRITEQSSNRVVMEYVANEETKAYYPFEFRFILTQEINDNEFKVVYTVENTGKDDLYYAVGSHYTYKVPIIPTEEQEDYLYRFGTAQKGGKFILENGLVVGKTDDIFSGSDRLMIGGLFENGSTILDLAEINSHYIQIENTKGTAYTRVAFDGFSYCVLWAPKGRSPFACIEPWTGLPDLNKDLTKKMGIIKLKSGMQKNHQQMITVG